MNEITEEAWNAVAARDARADGKFVFAVRTTGIYCRPSCPARRPHRANTSIFKTPAAAEAAGFRECRRCRPRSDGGPAAEARLVRAAEKLIAARAEESPRVSDIARELGVSPSKLSRLFSRHAGVTPKKFATARRFELFKKSARSSGVVEAQYAAGFGSPSCLYAAAGRHLGMAPGAWTRGGRGVTIRYGFASSPAGRLLVASTERGICAVELGSSKKDLEKRLRGRFPNAELRAERKAPPLDSPQDAGGSPFQRLVWKALRAIPAGTTQTYSQVARRIGRPGAARAVARACAMNPLALVVPCHRVVGSDGALRGYRWGVELKRRLLAAEAGRRVA
jgi:AraC family transcriptional regulator of adaptative response/methylated-DNA-[protein]-cysteine methyltransferase